LYKKGKSLSTGLKWRRKGSRGRKEKSVRDREKNYKSPKKICKCCKATVVYGLYNNDGKKTIS